MFQGLFMADPAAGPFQDKERHPLDLMDLINGGSLKNGAVWLEYFAKGMPGWLVSVAY